VADLVYRGLNIPPRKFKGKETVRIMQLEMIQDKHPLIAQIVEVQKLRADYETIDRLEPDTDGRLHCVFDPWGTRAGRVAGKEGLIYAGTNPMNIPKKARKLVVPDEGMFFMYPDMEQIEARNVAVLSKDEGLKAALTDIIAEKGRPDIHLFVKRELDKIDPHLLDGGHTAEFGYRQSCKKLEYAAFYGIRPSNLGKELGISERNAKKALDTFGYVFPGVPRWHRDTLEEALDTRTLVSPTGRLRTWPGYIYDPKLKTVKYEVAKEMWSYKPQDMAAYVLALGLIELKDDPDVEILIHVHDAPLLQGPIAKKDILIPRVLNALTRTLWGMTYPAESKTGMDWYEASS